MIAINYIFIVQLLFITLLNSFGASSEGLTLVLIFTHSLCVMIILTKKYKGFSLILITGYLLRLFTMIWDLYARNIFTLIGSGRDSEGFYQVIVDVSQNVSLLNQNIYGGLYTKILGVIAYFTGPNRLLLQYINVILGINIILVSLEILNKLNIKPNILRFSMLLIVFMPLSIIHSAILLRENVVSFFVILSLYFFITWIYESKIRRLILSIVFIFIASTFHSGVIGLVTGTALTAIFYNSKSKKYEINLKSILVAVIFSMIGFFVFINYKHVFLQKFSDLEDVNQLVTNATIGRGGSQYLTSFNIKGPVSLLLFTPVKIIYFLSSPLPHYWRGLGDIISFLIDGVVYCYLFISGIRLFSKKNNNPIQISMFISLIMVLIIFGIGINNAGTAMRHRNKIFEYIVIFWAYSISTSSIKEKSNNAVFKEKNSSK